MRPSSLAIIASGTLTCAAALVWVACETPLDPNYELTNARVLAIQSDPVDLVPDGSVALQALLYLPPGSPAPTYQWSWCAAVGSTLQCAVDAGQLTQILDQDGAIVGVNIDYSLGSNAQAVFPYPVNPTILQSACVRVLVEAGAEAGEDAAEVEGDEAGLPAVGGPGRLACTGTSWTIYVLLTVGVGDVSLQAARSLTAYLAPPTSINTNPTIVGLSPFTPSGPGSDAGLLADPGDQADGGVVEPPVGNEGDAGLVLAAQVPIAASELYGVTPLGVTEEQDASEDASEGGGLPPCPADAGDASFDGGCVREVYESLTMSWYVQGGLLEHATTTMPSARLGNPQDWSALLVNQWAPPSAQGTNQFVLVLRDNRGGVGWLQLPVQLPLQ
jgi:hypothetical protein